MTVNHELWRVVASGGLTLLLSKMVTITNVDTRAAVLGDFLGWLRVELASPTSLAFAVSQQTLNDLWAMIKQSAYYAPELGAQSVVMVENPTTTSNTLAADAPPTGHTILVYRFNGHTFDLLGELDDHSQPAAGNYVLVNRNDSTEKLSLPTAYLAIT